MSEKKTLDELTLMDDYMFAAVFQDTKFLKPLLEFILKIKIAKIELTDVDISILNPDNEYNKLRKSFVIFICNYDPFDRDRYIYTFENICREEPDLLFGDETVKVVVNTCGSRGEISDELKEIIRYLKDEEVTGEFSKALDDAVNAVKASEERRREYMLLNMRDNEIRAEARAEGRTEGRNEGRNEGLEEGKFLTIWNMVQSGLITIAKAAEFAGMSVQDFEKKVAAYAKS